VIQDDFGQTLRIYITPFMTARMSAAPFIGRDQRLDIPPFVIGQVVRISQVSRLYFLSVHTGSPLESRIKKASIESK
jgi:hypothetical protein